jgi:tetratricopeptide (TPR) repeat protein
MRHAGLVAVLVIAGCSSTAPRDASTLDRERASRTTIESECRTRAQRQARAEYAPQLQDAARLQWNSALMGSRTFGGVSAATVQGREWELFDACRVEQLFKVYKGLMEQNPPTADAYYNAAQIATRLGRPSDLEAAWKRLTTDFPDDALARKMALERASAAFKQKSWKSAVAYATQAATSDDDAVRSEAWLLVGESELKQKRNAEAVKAFTAVLAVAEVDGGVRYRARGGRGLAHEKRQEWDAALADYEAVAKGGSDSTLRDWALERASAVNARLNKPASGTTPAPSMKPTAQP